MTKGPPVRGRVIVFLGLTGSGKSYLAKSLAERQGCLYLNTDVVRKKLVGIVPSDSAISPVDCGIYSQQLSRLVYDSMLGQAERALEENEQCTVILDGSYYLRNERKKLLRHFSCYSNLLFIYCYCNETLTRKRLDIRRNDSTAVSDGNWEVYQLQKQRFEEPIEISPKMLLKLDTDRSLEYLMERLYRFLHTSSC